MKKLMLSIWLMISISTVTLSLTMPVYVTANHLFIFIFMSVVILSASLILFFWTIDSKEKLKNFRNIVRSTESKWSPWIISPTILFAWIIWPFLVFVNCTNDKKLELEKYGIKSIGTICDTWKEHGKNGSYELCKVSHIVDYKKYYFKDRLIRNNRNKSYNPEVKIIYSKRYPNVGIINRQK